MATAVDIAGSSGDRGDTRLRRQPAASAWGRSPARIAGGLRAGVTTRPRWGQICSLDESSDFALPSCRLFPMRISGRRLGSAVHGSNSGAGPAQSVNHLAHRPLAVLPARVLGLGQHVEDDWFDVVDQLFARLRGAPDLGQRLAEVLSPGRTVEVEVDEDV